MGASTLRSLAAIAVVAARTGSLPWDDAGTAACLSDGAVECRDDGACGERASFSRACLDSFVPFRTPYRRVRCCLRCCFRFHLRRYGLDANWRRFAAVGGAARAGGEGMLEVLVGHDGESTLPFATRRLSKTQIAWLNSKDPALAAALPSLGDELQLRCRGDACAERDRRETEQRLWSVARTGTPGPGDEDLPALGAGDVGAGFDDGWVEAHFPDGCGSAGRQLPFAAYREVHLAALLHVVAPDGNLTLVSSTDCDLPHATAPPLVRDGFRGEGSLLRNDALRSWYTTNPSDHLGPVPGGAKLRAVPIGVASRGDLLPHLDGREAAQERPQALACCCMSSHPTPALAESPGAPPAHSSFARLDDKLRALYDNVTHLVAPGALDWKYAHHGWAGEVYTRVRRFAIVHTLKAAGFPNCTHGLATAAPLPGASRRQNKLAHYADQLLASDFVVSPQGKGRACHREWEALAAGAIPLVDWDASRAMADLYDELPVVRVRDWRDVTPAFLRAARADVLRRATAREIDMRKLYVPYWIARFTEAMAPRHRPRKRPRRSGPRADRTI